MNVEMLHLMTYKCEFTSRTKGSVKIHENSLHKGIKYECEECGLHVKYNQSLKSHKRAMHGIDLFKCQTCSHFRGD